MDLETFVTLPISETARLVREAGLGPVVFPLNGTRRWFALEHADQGASPAEYFDIVKRRHIEVCQLLYDHGLEVLLMPAFSTHIAVRGSRYWPIAADALRQLTADPAYLEFYDRNQIRVRFYGEFRQYLRDTDPDLIENFESIMARTAAHNRHRLFYGVFAHDAIETAARLGADFFRAHGRAPDKAELVEGYYGEALPPISMFIGFSQFRAFDFGVAATGREALYFTVSPSPYLTVRQWREILYDYLYARRGSKLDYSALSPSERAAMRAFYRANVGRTVGVGERHSAGFWHPLPQVVLGDDALRAGD